jgi:MFS transporter, ACS family, hexuronate transporter
MAVQESISTRTGAAVSETPKPLTHYRWTICALLFFATTINYVDRQIIGILKPALQSELGWNEIDYSNIVFAFQVAYALGLISVGAIIDKLGTRLAFAGAVVVWSVAAIGHAIARGVTGFSVARFVLGFGEAANFPASIKTVAEWFPKKERALATGIFNSGTNIAALSTPIAVPIIVDKLGWEWAFIITGALGFIWLAAWLLMYQKPESHPRCSPSELAYIQSDADVAEEKVKWSLLFPHKETWAFAIGKFLTDPIWWVYLFWLPDFLSKKHGLDLKGIGLPLVVIYLAASVGSIGGGWISSTLIARNVSVNTSRKIAMLICALCVVPMLFAAQASNLWVAVGLISLAAAAHQGWSANLFTTVSDTFPKQAVGSVVGIGGMAGAVGGMFIAKTVGYILDATGSYILIFVIAGSAYLVALAAMHAIVPTIRPINLSSSTRTASNP